MKSPRQFFLILAGVAALTAAFAESAYGFDLGGAIKRAEQTVNGVKNGVDKAAAQAQNGVNQVQGAVDKVQDTADQSKAKVDAVTRKYADFKETVVEVKAQAEAVAADRSAVTDLLANLSNAVDPPAQPVIAVTPSHLDVLVAVEAGPSVKVTRQAVLRGLPLQLGNYALDAQVLQAEVAIGDPARGIGCVPQILDDQKLSAWLQDQGAPGVNLALALACPADKLGTYSAAAKAGTLVADVACDLLEVTRSDGTKFQLVRPTHVDVRLAGSAGTASGN